MNCLNVFSSSVYLGGGSAGGGCEALLHVLCQYVHGEVVLGEEHRVTLLTHEDGDAASVLCCSCRRHAEGVTSQALATTRMHTLLVLLQLMPDLKINICHDLFNSFLHRL